MPRRGRRSGPREELRKLFEAHHRDLCAFARRYVSSDAAARDVVQEVFVRVWERRQERPVGDVRRPYLYRAVRNEALNRRETGSSRRERLRAYGAPTGDEGGTPAEDFERRELRRRLEKAVEALPPRCREVFLLVRRDGLTYREAADALDLSPSTVDTQMGRALEKLRGALGPGDG